MEKIERKQSVKETDYNETPRTFAQKSGTSRAKERRERVAQDQSRRGGRPLGGTAPLLENSKPLHTDLSANLKMMGAT